jgi:demethylmacrocin O-methyltransferase
MRRPAKRLRDLFNQYGSDKTKNGYAPYYETLFHHMRYKNQKLLEIGIGTMIPNVPSSMVGYALENYKPGGSLRAWRDFFEHFEIVGCDVQPDTQFTDDRIRTILADSTDDLAINNALGDCKFDIIIDDGSHLDTHQLLTLRNTWKRVNDGGFYIIEDVYPGSRIAGEFIPHIESIIGKEASYFFSTEKNLCIILKHAYYVEG